MVVALPLLAVLSESEKQNLVIVSETSRGGSTWLQGLFVTALLQQAPSVLKQYTQFSSDFFNQCALRFLQRCLTKMPKNCIKIVYKVAGGWIPLFSYTKSRVFIMHHNYFLDSGILIIDDIIS